MSFHHRILSNQKVMLRKRFSSLIHHSDSTGCRGNHPPSKMCQIMNVNLCLCSTILNAGDRPILPVVSCNFGLKSNMWLRIALSLRVRAILWSRGWLHTKLLSTQWNYHYKYLSGFFVGTSLCIKEPNLIKDIYHVFPIWNIYSARKPL